MSRSDTSIAVYASHVEAEDAVKKLLQLGFDMKKLSIVARDYHTAEQVVGYYNILDRMKYWGKLGASWGGGWGFLLGSVFLWMPTLAPLWLAVPVVGWVLGVIVGAIALGVVTAVGAGLYGIRIPKNSIVRYVTAIKNGSYVVLVHGNREDVEFALLISRTGPVVVERRRA